MKGGIGGGPATVGDAGPDDGGAVSSDGGAGRADLRTDTARIAIWVDGTAAALGLAIDPEHRPGVLHYAALAAGFAAIVEAVPLSPHDEAAVRFEPVAPVTRAGSDA